MANSLSNVQQTVFEQFHQALAGQPENYKKLGRVIESDQANLQKGLVQGGSYFAEYTAAKQNVLSDLLSGKVVFASKAYAQQHQVSFKEVADSPQMMTDVAVMLANNAAKSLNKLPFDGLCALNAVDHPLAGSAINQVGTKKVFDTGLAYLQGVTGAGTQQSLFTSPLSRASVEGDLQTLFNWKSIVSGIPLEITPEEADLVMVCGASNRELAMQLRGSEVSSMDQQTNSLKGIFDLCLAPLTRTEDYYLIARKMDFCGAWIRQYPQIIIKMSENGLDVIFAAHFIANFWFNPEAAGAVAHLVG